MLRYIYYKLNHYGFDARKFFSAIKTPSWFYRDLKNLKLQKNQDTTFRNYETLPHI